jgi:hypothetical protein
MVFCKICGGEYKNLYGLSKHITKAHSISSEEYYLKYLGEEKRTCPTCGKETPFKNLVKGYQKYCNLKCSNSDPSKKRSISNIKKEWWKNSDKVVDTKVKISSTVGQLWRDKNSIYNSIQYRRNLTSALEKRWHIWKETQFKEVCNLYGFEVISSYENAHTTAEFKCLKCGEKVETVWNYLQSGKLCPNCFHSGSSKAQDDIFGFLKDNISAEVFRNYNKLIYPLEVDIFIPSKNIAIEYNGLWTHSHNCEWGGKDQSYHINKTIQCEKHNVRLIHIFEDEWIFKQNIVKNKLLNILNERRDLQTIYARKCHIKEITAKQKNLFLDYFHLQGKDSSLIKLGAFYDNKLVSVMTFSSGNISKGSRPKENIWELSRFCSNYNYRVPGIASKFLAYFKRNYKWKKIFSYADRRWSQGNLYYKLGFDLEQITKCNYWYIKNYKRIHRFNLRKTNDDPENISEFSLRKAQGYNWIWDCGNLKFSMEV